MVQLKPVELLHEQDGTDLEKLLLLRINFEDKERVVMRSLCNKNGVQRERDSNFGQSVLRALAFQLGSLVLEKLTIPVRQTMGKRKRRIKHVLCKAKREKGI